MSNTKLHIFSFFSSISGYLLTEIFLRIMSLTGKINYIKLFFVKYEAYNGSDLSFLAEIYIS